MGIDKLEMLRAELARRQLQGLLLPTTDEHLSEHGGGYARRLAWLTAFLGSGACAVVLPTDAAIFVDGRYTLQVRQQVDQCRWTCHLLSNTSIANWLAKHVPAYGRIGYDPWLHTKDYLIPLRCALAECGAELVAVDVNPVDAIWVEQPVRPEAQLIAHPDRLAGKKSVDKRRELAEWLRKKRADCVVLSALDSIAWLFNLRGQDVEHTPVALAYAIVNADESSELFVDPRKLTYTVHRHLGVDVRVHAYDDFARYILSLTSKTVVVDRERSPDAILSMLSSTGAKIVEARDPVVLAKAIKNATEIGGQEAAHVRDGVALTRFLYWATTEMPSGSVTEITAAMRLRKFRENTGHLRSLSFATISAFGPNGAIVHYRPSEQTCLSIVQGSLYLVDSGGQYVDGTTDVTRTIAIGVPTAEMRDRFTRVLKGHIALARATFPEGTCGGQLDPLARQFLWDAGLDYAHGTGHGVGAHLSVHEGPQRICRFGSSNGSCEPLLAGMILSNEPGYYKEGEYGIRIENLMLVVECKICGAEQRMLGFKLLTLAPIDADLMDLAMLTAAEHDWIDAYHARVASVVGPHLNCRERDWLTKATRPLASRALKT